MTRDEFYNQDIIERLKDVQELIMAGVDQVVFDDGDTAIYVTDVIQDAIVSIKRLRNEMPK